MKWLVYRKPIGEAAADEHYGPMVREFYAKAATTARTSDGIHKCADCGRPWSDDVALVSVAIVDFLGASKQFMAMIMGLCAECDQENDTPEKLVSLLKRDDVLKPEAKVEIRDVSAPAHS
jgi:5-methylcytosine-specific restriction endonuclease McrA